MKRIRAPDACLQLALTQKAKVNKAEIIASVW